MIKTRWLWYWIALKAKHDPWGMKIEPHRWMWQHCKTWAGWYQIMRFGFFGVNVYREKNYFVPGSTFELWAVNENGLRVNGCPKGRAD